MFHLFPELIMRIYKNGEKKTFKAWLHDCGQTMTQGWLCHELVLQFIKKSESNIELRWTSSEKEVDSNV